MERSDWQSDLAETQLLIQADMRLPVLSSEFHVQAVNCTKRMKPLLLQQGSTLTSLLSNDWSVIFVKTIARLTLIFSAVALTTLGVTALMQHRASGQAPVAMHGPQLIAAEGYSPEVKIEVRDGYRYISSNGIPDHPTGRFPNSGNPNSISPQSYHYRATLTPKIADRPTATRIFGVAINGVPFDPGTAELWNGNFQWHYEALSGLLFSQGGLGVDENLAHVQPNGAYHYHGLPMGLLKKMDYKRRMALVGYAADGFPIYGPFAYSSPNDASTPLKMLRSSYRLKSGNRPGGADGPGGAHDGSFEQDYEYRVGLGDLDASNGREGITPEYPKGTYYYVITGGWPFVPRQVRGTPDSSFSQGRPGGPGGPGRPRGPGGQQGGGQGFGPGGPGGGGPGGFGGPGGPMGPPPGFVPGDLLGDYLGLTKSQREKLDRLMKTVSALRSENFAIPAFTKLKLTNDQISRIAGGAKAKDVLTTAQKKVMAANMRPQFRGPDGPGGPGGPGGQQGGGPGSPDGPPPGE